ncbi:MAG: hypothetical protein KC486_12110 [Myxococcales bacterium]|nr:hypothetical protein [Myxococcales bacterium]
MLWKSTMTTFIPVTPLLSTPAATRAIRLRADIEALALDLAAGERRSRTPAGVPSEVEDALALRFRQLFRDLEAASAELSAADLDELTALISARFYPWVAASGLADRAVHKPAGYAGDFRTILMVYADVPCGACWAGRFIDARVLESPAAWAVKNRRGLLAAEIEATMGAAEAEGRRAQIASLGAGPAEELFDVWQRLGDADARGRMPLATLCDMDEGALGHVRARSEAEGCADALQAMPVNLARAALGRSDDRLADQDLIYSAGLIDYFKDNLLVRLLDWIYDGLRPGGRTVLGNFHPDNPTRRMMETSLEWVLIHRDEDDMRRIFARSRFGADSLRFFFDPSGVNLFVEATRLA